MLEPDGSGWNQVRTFSGTWQLWAHFLICQTGLIASTPELTGRLELCVEIARRCPVQYLHNVGPSKVVAICYYYRYQASG